MPAGGRQKAKAYRRPELIEYGPVAKLTQGTLTQGGDGAMGGFRMGMMMGCL